MEVLGERLVTGDYWEINVQMIIMLTELDAEWIRREDMSWISEKCNGVLAWIESHEYWSGIITAAMVIFLLWLLS